LAQKFAAEKRHRQSERRRVRNKAVRSQVRTSIRNFEEAVASSDAGAAQSAYTQVTKLMDSAVNKGVFHKNTAARTKSRLHKRLHALS
jgi:small subunit ribosomal protein S20